MKTALIGAAAEGMPAISRRAVITGTAVTAAALAASTLPAATAGESAIMRLFREWKAIDNAIPVDIADEDLKVACDRLNAIEAAIMRLPSSSASDLAAKFLLAHRDGEFIIETDSPLVVEAHALCGGMS